jgi:hypothetical protein
MAAPVDLEPELLPPRPLPQARDAAPPAPDEDSDEGERTD